jgi:hypothetical protein
MSTDHPATPSPRAGDRRLALLAVTIYAVAWFVPVIEGGGTLSQGELPGFQALLVALGPLVDRQSNDGVIVPFLAVLSGLGNGVFVAAAVVAARGAMRGRRGITIALGLAALANLLWIFLSGFSDLRIGFYLWFLAYPLLLFALLERRPATGST